MSTFSSLPALERRLSIEETYYLADTARRKSSSQASRNHLRMKLGHTHMLEALEHVIRTSPPPSPKQMSSTLSRQSRSISSTTSALESQRRSSPPPTVAPITGTDEYGFDYDDGEEDFDSLSLTKTISRR